MPIKTETYMLTDVVNSNVHCFLSFWYWFQEIDRKNRTQTMGAKEDRAVQLKTFMKEKEETGRWMLDWNHMEGGLKGKKLDYTEILSNL